MSKLIISYYKSESENYKFVLSAKTIWVALCLIVAPYFLMFSFVLSSKGPKEHVVVNVPLREEKVVQPTPELSLKKNDVIKLAQSSLAKHAEFKVTEFVNENNSNGVSVKFLLSKIRNDSSIKSGTVKAEALDESGKIVAESNKSIFKFQFSRISIFDFNSINIAQVSKFRIKVKNEISDSEEVITIPVK